MRRARLLLVLGLLACSAGEAAAQAYPTGPIRWLIGFTAGGTADMISRDIANHLEKVLGQPIIIENRPGANGSTPPGGANQKSTCRSTTNGTAISPSNCSAHGPGVMTSCFAK